MHRDSEFRQGDRGVASLSARNGRHYSIKREHGMRLNPSPEDRIQPDSCLIALGSKMRQLELAAALD